MNIRSLFLCTLAFITASGHMTSAKEGVVPFQWRDHELVTTIAELQRAGEALVQGNDRLAIDLEGFRLGRTGILSLVQVARESEGPVYLIDVIKLRELEGSKEKLTSEFKKIFEGCPKEKLLFDVRADAAALYYKYDGVCLTNVRDLQILYTSSKAHGNLDQYLSGAVMQNLSGMEVAIKYLNISEEDRNRLLTTKAFAREIMRSGEGQGAIWCDRPLAKALLDYATNDVSVLFSIHHQWCTKMPDVELSLLSKTRVVAQHQKVVIGSKVRLVNMQNGFGAGEKGIIRQCLSTKGHCHMTHWLVELEKDAESIADQRPVLEVEEANLEFEEAHQDAQRDFPLPAERRLIKVKGIGPDAPEGCLQAYFQRFGRIAGVGEAGQSESAAIEFVEPASARAAVLAVDHFPIGLSSMPIDVDWIDSVQKFVPLYMPWKSGMKAFGSKRLFGVVKSLSNTFGFIACPQIHRICGFDVFITTNDANRFTIGQEVSFTITYYKPGRPQAREIRARSSEERYEGTIKTFDAEQRYGFIEGPQVMEAVGKEIYFKVSQGTIVSVSSHALEAGTNVSFQIRLSENGISEAVNLKIGSLPSTSRQERFSGYIKVLQKQCGFIECPEAKQKFGHDVFLPYAKAEAYGLDVGAHVSFKVHLNARGLPEAADVQNLETNIVSSACEAAPLVSGLTPFKHPTVPDGNVRPTPSGGYPLERASAAPDGHLKPAASAGYPQHHPLFTVKPAASTGILPGQAGSTIVGAGQVLPGVVKSIGSKHGFIQCEQVKEQFGNDVFCPAAYLHGIRVGAQVNFRLGLSAKGQPQATWVESVGHNVGGQQVAAPIAAGQPQTASVEPARCNGAKQDLLLQLLQDKDSSERCYQ